MALHKTANTAQSKSYTPGRRPAEEITGIRPQGCSCSWAYSNGKMRLKYVNALCGPHGNVPTIGAGVL